MCRSAVNDGSCSPWVMCSCSVVRGNQIRDRCTLSLICLCEYKLLKKCGMSFMRVLDCNPGNVCVCVRIKCDVWSLKKAGIVCNKLC